MTRFRFNLEQVLEQRRREEREAQTAFARVDRERIGLEDRLRGHQRSIIGFKRDLRAALTGGKIRFSDVRLQAGASLTVTAQAQADVLQLAGIHKRLEAERARLLEATRARKAVERLKERRYEQWKRAIDRKEAAELDDLASGRAAREAAAGAGIAKG